MKLLKTISPILFLLGLSYWSIVPLFHEGFFPIHDDTQVQRVYEMKIALADGMFPVRWVPDLGYGYGYPIFNFYAPLAYYIGGFLNLVGFDSLQASKIMIGLGMLSAGVFMYLLGREFWGRGGAVISGLLYLYAPYHAVNLYVRGAIAELWAYAFIPLAFYGLYKVYLNREDRKKRWIWVSIAASGYASIVLSHNLTAMMVSPFLLVVVIVLFLIASRAKKQRSNWFIPFSFLFGIILSAFYWLPIFFEMQYTNVLSVIGGGSDYKDHFVCLTQLWSSQWGFAGSAPGCLDGMSFMLGKLHIVLASLAIIPLLLQFRNKIHRYTIVLAFLGLALSLVFMLDVSKFIWDGLSQMAFFQFPWRFLVLSSFFIAFLGGAVVITKPGKLAIGFTAIAAIVIVILNAELFVPSSYTTMSAQDYTDKSSIRWKTSQISDEYMPKNFAIPQKQSEIPQKKLTFSSPNTKVAIVQDKTHLLEAKITTDTKTTAMLATAYFPAWQMYIDGKQVPYAVYDKGMKVTILEGVHTFQAAFVQTPIEAVANLISLTGVLGLIAGIISTRKLNYGGKKAKS